MEKRMTLYNKDHPVLQILYDDELHLIVKIMDIYDLNYAPPGMLNHKGMPDRSTINDWWRGRTIPASRQHLQKDFPYLDNVSSLPEQNMGLSLSDRYWMTDEPGRYQWSEINFFDNSFSDDLGAVTLGEKQQSCNNSENMFSPNSTLNGDLQKKWTIQEGIRILLKSGSGPFYQEPYNETIATELYKSLLRENEFVPYSMQGHYCACPNMLREDEELVPMWDLIKNHKKPNNRNDYQFCVDLCQKQGIPEAQVKEHFEKMFTCDFILANHDRHYRNFALIRNVETLLYTRMAPIYDTGASLWHDKFTLDKDMDYMYTAKPFGMDGMKPADQLKLFDDFSWFDSERLKDFSEKAKNVLNKNPLMSEKRIDAVMKGLEYNISYVENYIRK